MKLKINPSRSSALRATVLALSAATLATNVATATPYATSLTNNAGIVSFRLNQATTTNDSVWIISSAGTVTNTLQLPGTAFIDRGLIVTNLGIAPGTFKVRIKHVGSGVISTNSPSIPFNSPRGIAANRNPASPYFGWVYVANSAAGTKGDGMFAYGSDLSDILGQGAVAKSGGYNFATGGASAPYHTSVAPDDSVLVTDWSDASGNLISMTPTLDSFSYVLKQINLNGAASPVGSNNVHGSVITAVMVGSGASRKLYTMDEDYQSDPASGAAVEWNSAWEYDIGATSVPWSNAPNRKLMTPYLASFSGQNQKMEVIGHYLYANQRRSNPPQHSAYIVDLNNLQDPSTFTGATPWGNFWASQDESLAEGYSDDVLRDTMTISVSPDGLWFAAIIAAGSSPISAPDGTTFTNNANDIILIPLTNGIPNIPARQVFSWGGAANGRDLAFDAAHNLYVTSSGVALVQSLDIGESTDVTTGSDGTFTLGTPPTQVSVSASTPLAHEQGSAPGVVTITRTPEDIGNPVTVFFTLLGSATYGTDYTVGGGALITRSNCVIAAGQTSTNISIIPVDDNIPELTETVILTTKGSGGYSVGFPNSAQIAIVDNDTPQLQILSLSTNIYQGTTNDYAGLLIRRLGDTNVQLTLNAASFAFGGTAVPNVDYYVPNLPFTIDAGVVDYSNAFIYPGLSGSTAVGQRSIFLTNVAGAGYTVTNNTATTFLQLKSVGAETVLFSDNFENDPVGTNWNVFFATYTNAPTDYNLIFGYDYAAGGVGNLSPIPAAPHSTSGDTKGLYMTVNKNDSLGVSAALNLYLKNHTFSGNYALRFDMFLVRNSSGTAQSQVEDSLFGINHDGTHTNWFRNSVTGTSLPEAATASDGLFFDVGSDGNGGGGAPYDFACWSGPTYTNTVNVVGPTNFLSRSATTTRQIFKKPPFDAGTAAGGDPANTVVSATPTWVEVEVSQVVTPGGNFITYKINNTVIMSFLNTNATSVGYTSGTVMLGYVDPWDDIGNTTAGSGEAAVIFDNVRVVSLSPPVIATQPHNIVAPAGTATNLTVAASTVSGTINYQWQHAGTNLPGATSATLSFPSLAYADFGTYSVTVDDGAYPTTSSSVTVLPPAPVVVTQPLPTTRAGFVGETIIPAFTVVGNSFSQVTNYQWYVNNAPFAGRTNASVSITNAVSANFGPYFVTVNDGFTSVTSSVVNLTVAARQTVASSASGSTFTLKFGSEFGPAYVVEYKTNLVAGPWIPLSTNAGTGSQITVNDSLLAAPTRFYRVRMQ